MQSLSVNTTPSKCGSGGSQSMLSTNSYSAKETIYTTIGLFQVQILNHMLKHNCTSQIISAYTLSLFMVQGNEVGIKYLKNQILTDVKKPSVIAEFNMVKFQIFSEIPFYPNRSQANTLLILVYSCCSWKKWNTRTWYSSLVCVLSHQMSVSSCSTARKEAWRFVCSRVYSLSGSPLASTKRELFH